VAIIGMNQVVSLLEDIKSRHVDVALDDFGTGFSSLSYLDRLPVDRLKIDRSFISLLDSERTGARIAETIISLGQTLGIEVLAEGVEEIYQSDILKKIGCTEAQGFLYARPMPLDELMAWLAAWKRKRP
jgi:EAL domain-containing protein (putative c-di-GMP-specific phosphodiesterase class I)